MAVSFRVTSVAEKGDMVTFFGQLVFTGNYVSGGDSLLNAAGAVAPELFPPGLPANTASMPVFLFGQTAPHVTRQPFIWNIQMESGYVGIIVPGSGSFNFKIKVWDPGAAKAELSAGAYPASVLAAVFNTLEISYKKNI
jgi:hypothetical protein